MKPMSARRSELSVKSRVRRFISEIRLSSRASPLISLDMLTAITCFFFSTSSVSKLIGWPMNFS